VSSLPAVRFEDVVRRLPIGAELQPEGGVHFRVWAPTARRIDVVHEKPSSGSALTPLSAEGNGYFSGTLRDATAGTRYRYRIDSGERLFPDPASRFQPDGPHDCSQVVDPASFQWTDAEWRGQPLGGAVIYEMHIGTFTREGTWRSAIEELPALAALGITVLEVMPVAEFSGRFGWGYDGVDLFAPTRLYGRPDDMRAFVDRAHALGMAVILDVVYNHLGPDGAYLKPFSAAYFTDRYQNEWGEPLNFDGEDSGPVREYFIANAGYWVDEFHIDGLRLDATQQIFDASAVNVMVEITRRVREAAAGRHTLVIAENEPQDVQLVKAPEHGGYGMDGLWNDDFHHAAIVATTGRNEAYYSDYFGSAHELLAAAKQGFIYQGQRYRWQGKRRGSVTRGISPAALVNYVQNHDQVANSAFGKRLHDLTSPGRYRAITALLLLAPGTPMLFQGQEFAASSPFLFFADHRDELAAAVRKGRAEFLSQFPSIATTDVKEHLADPADQATFERCKLDHGERESHAAVLDLHRDLLTLRREEPCFRAQRREDLDGAVLGPEAFVLRYFGAAGDDRLLIVNLGRALHFFPSPEPLLAPPAHGQRWTSLWCSEDAKYGGAGSPPLEGDDGWRIPGEGAFVLRPEPEPPPRAQS
jgi:maltooligosyltrehalose trehalohydrolase